MVVRETNRLKTSNQIHASLVDECKIRKKNVLSREWCDYFCPENKKAPTTMPEL
jgi:hypothetical protein